MPKNHKWIEYSAQGASRERARQILVFLADYGTSTGTSWSRLRKARTISWTDKSGQKRSCSWRPDSVVDAMCRTGDLDSVGLGLPLLGSRTVPADFVYAHDVPPMLDAATGEHLQVRVQGSLGPAFPIVPCLDREGAIISSFEPVLHDSIVDSHGRLVEASEKTLTIEWMNNLRVLINDVVSSVDVALNHLYLLAEYAPKASWRFDREQLGVRHGRRMEDKLAWVEAITGCPLNARDARSAFATLRELRNHLNHFDPPCFAYTIEDAAGWLNLVPEAGVLLWEMRRCIGEPLPRALIRWLLLRPVRWVAADPSRARPSQLAATGYASARARKPS